MDIKVYYCLDLNNENSEIFQIRGKSEAEDERGEYTKLDIIQGTQTTMKELCAKGYRLVSATKLSDSTSQTVMMLIFQSE